MASQNVELTRPILSCREEESNLKDLIVTFNKHILTKQFLQELNLEYSNNVLKSYAKKIGKYIYVFDLSQNNIKWT